MKNIFVLSSLMTLSIFAVSPGSSRQVKAQMPSDPNPCARFGNCEKSGVFLTGEAIWFKPIQKIEKGVKYVQLSDGYNAESTVSYFNHKFAPGYRVALGYNTPYDGWDIALSYTGFNYKYNNPYIYDTSQGNPQKGGEFSRNGNLKAIYYYNLGDLDLGRMFKVSKHLNLRPHAGIRSLWLTQKLHYSFETDPKYIIEKQSGNLTGLEGGVEGLWKFSKEFSFYANFAVACLINSQEFSYKTTVANYYNPDESLASNDYTNYGSNVVTNLDAFIGFRWDRNFSNGDYHFGINLGYEIHDYINVNQSALTHLAASTITYSNGQDFALQGVSLGARFDF